MASAAITVRNSGGYVATFNVSYDLAGSRQSVDSGDFSLGVNKSITVPDGATNIVLTVEEYWFFGSKTTIFTQALGSPATKFYKVWGTTLNPSWCETDGNFDCLGGGGTCMRAAAVTSNAFRVAPAAKPTSAVSPASASTSPHATPTAEELASAGSSGIEGCIALFAGLSLCYDLQIAPPSVDISLVYAGIKLASLELSAAKPCATLKGDYKVVSWDLQLCLNLDQRNVTLSGKACTLGMCKSFQLVITHW